MASRGRYLKPAEFGRLLADLRITSNMFQDRLLEWFEEQRIILPVARIRWPDWVVLESRGIEPNPRPTDEERAEAEQLHKALRLWNRPDLDSRLDHPLDDVNPPGASLVDRRIGDRPFESWDSMRTNVAAPDAEPLYVSTAAETYYHDWQALLVADAMEMGVHLVFDTRDPDLRALALGDDLAGLTPVPRWCIVSLEAPGGLTAGLRWASFLDAAARVEIVRDRKLSAIWRAHGFKPFTLEGAERDDFVDTSKREAVARVAEIGAGVPDVVGFIVYLSDRWDEWSRRGRAEVAGEYARQLRRALRLAKDAFNLTHEQVEAEVGQAFGDGFARLAAILPDWTKEARGHLDRSLRHVVLPRAPSAGPDLTLVDPDVTDLLDWMSEHTWKVHLAIEEIIEHQAGASPESHDAHARAVESLTTALEHLVGDLLGEANIPPSGTLMTKLQRLWSSDSDVLQALETHRGLSGTKQGATRADRLATIAALPPAGDKTGVTQTLLRAVLYRNDGLHNSMSGWPDDELHDAAIAVLTALLFCRKHTLVNPPNP
jgi:hypothetical protein